MATGEYCGIILVLAFCASAVVECQITSSPGNQTVCIGEDLDLEWVYGDALNFLTVTWAFIDSSSTTISILEQVTGLPAEIKNNFNVVHKSNGGITLTRVNQANTGSYKISVVYSSATPSADDTVTVTVNDCSSTTSTSTTTPPSSTSTTTPPSTSTTTPPSPASSTTPPSTTNKSPDIVIIIVPCVLGGVAVIVVLISIIICLRRKNNRKKKNRDVPDTNNTYMSSF